MSELSGYLMALIGAGFLSGGLTLLSPNGQFEKVLRVLSGVFLLLVLLAPLPSLAGEIQDFTWEWKTIQEESQETGGYLTQPMEKTLSREISACVQTVTGREPVSVESSVDWSGESFSLNEVVIRIRKEDESKKQAIIDYVAFKTGVRARVLSE